MVTSTDEEISIYCKGEQLKKQCKKWINKFYACSSVDEFRKVEQNYGKSKLSTELVGNSWYSRRHYRDFFMWQYIFKSLNDKSRFNILMEYMSDYTCAGSLVREICTIFDPDDVIAAYNYTDSSKQGIYNQKKRFLKGDLSDTDLLLCDGLKNLNDTSVINLQNARVTSTICEKFGIPYEPYKIDNNRLGSVSCIEENEKSTELVLQTSRELDTSYESGDLRLLMTKERIYYVSDIHLMHKLRDFEPKSKEDVVYAVKSIVSNIVRESEHTILIGGDVCSDFQFKCFGNR